MARKVFKGVLKAAEVFCVLTVLWAVFAIEGGNDGSWVPVNATVFAGAIYFAIQYLKGKKDYEND